ncbi:HAMP domain-containing sensor histidine kinase [Paraconexibacter algicola]|uniref:histidine kinase n=1 Tax=Paraconexibacter algicola TaxID=2133960 RepID=A0A2T4UKG0_9ACTN|nr:HAMP domain-containing sensor histidine kinase [Paraconexibacter algicola]PTL59729.1 two-component sensor histidine kinase [Paraconexibacter algicola]
MRRWSSLRVRLTLGCVALVVVLNAGVLGLSWGLMDRHLERTVPAQYATDVASELARQYVLAVVGAGLLALALAWAGAGRLLAPVRRIAATARRVGEGDDLRERVRLPDGPQDELHDLAVTFDGMLDRVEGAVGAQRRFVANASHELRTPLTSIRAEVEVALDDPDATAEELRAVLRSVVETGEGAERLIDGLLVLAGATDGVPRREPVDLADAAGRALDQLGLERVPGRVEPVVVRGDDVLLTRVVVNLVENAIVHGEDPELDVRREDGDRAVVEVRSRGPQLDPQLVDRLHQPFERGGRTRREGRGAGLGLSIVHQVARAHGGTLRLHARPGGGLVARVELLADPVPAPAAGQAARRDEAAVTPT